MKDDNAGTRLLILSSRARIVPLAFTHDDINREIFAGAIHNLIPTNCAIISSVITRNSGWERSTAESLSIRVSYYMVKDGSLSGRCDICRVERKLSKVIIELTTMDGHSNLMNHD